MENNNNLPLSEEALSTVAGGARQSKYDPITCAKYKAYYYNCAGSMSMNDWCEHFCILYPEGFVRMRCLKGFYDVTTPNNGPKPAGRI